jgi:hypothetical protein
MNQNNVVRFVLTEREFSKAIGLSYAKVKSMRQGGEITKYLQVGRRIMYKPEHIDLFLQNHEVELSA